MARERLTESEIRQAIRAGGEGDLAQVGAVVLETDGSLSVFSSSSMGSRSALSDVEASAPSVP